ncbi:unnamed protein product [Lactuca virosa]|uniref:Uncharacterized protein n=1 Tax=Lactuca virosa TaxID=75947 RepID=A0AAU9LZY3_9ASTR|nr:unnamed protein product [Lactuca virosa]
MAFRTRICLSYFATETSTSPFLAQTAIEFVIVIFSPQSRLPPLSSNTTRKMMKTANASLLLVVSDGVTGVQEWHQSFTGLPVLYNRLSTVC